jgi:cytochrome c oxidase assembly protein subunit 15
MFRVRPFFLARPIRSGCSPRGVRLDRFQRFALATTAATYLLLAVGGLVRAAGAGLGCPDWPKCFGLWIPPTDAGQLPPGFDRALFNVAHTWIEYLNRVLGALVGLLILITSILAVRRHRHSARVLWPTLAALLLVLVVAWLGREVVRTQLSPVVLTAHLVLALMVASLLLYATFSAFFPEGRPPELPNERRLLGRVALSVIGLSLFQVAVGAAVRGEVQLIARGPVPRDLWLSAVGLIDVAHRNLAVLVTAAVFALAALAERPARSDPRLRAWTRGCAGLVAAQVLAGLGLAYLGFPRVLQVAHMWLACLLLASLTIVVLLAYRLGPSRAASSGNDLNGAGSRRER